MVSNSLSARRGLLRRPIVCRKSPTAPTAPCSPDPQDIVTSWYDVDVSWLWFNHVFSGSIILQRTTATHWQTPTPPPADGEWGTFDWMPALAQFNAGLLHYMGGVQQIVIVITAAPLPPNCPFNTNQFDYVSGLWVGKKHGKIFNV